MWCCRGHKARGRGYVALWAGFGRVHPFHIVVHRQLLHAVQSEPDQAMQLSLQGSESARAKPVMSHAELASAAGIMNERHRASKRAQKECSDLYLLLLLHR